VSGLWHGASWSFVIWGAYHGFFLVIERIFLLKFYKKIGKIPSIIITFLIVVVGWVFFRIEQFDLAIIYLGKMFTLNQNIVDVKIIASFNFFLVIAFFFSFFTLVKVGAKADNFFFATPNYRNSTYYWMIPVALMLFVLSLSSITSTGFNPFIYFRF